LFGTRYQSQNSDCEYNKNGNTDASRKGKSLQLTNLRKIFHTGHFRTRQNEQLITHEFTPTLFLIVHIRKLFLFFLIHRSSPLQVMKETYPLLVFSTIQLVRPMRFLALFSKAN